MRISSLFLTAIAAATAVDEIAALTGFVTTRPLSSSHDTKRRTTPSLSPFHNFEFRRAVISKTNSFMNAKDEDGMIELIDEDDDAAEITNEESTERRRAPFLSQGEISKESLSVDLTDAKQTRVIIYIVLSLIPVLLFIPLILGSRDLIPLESLPPVSL